MRLKTEILDIRLCDNMELMRQCPDKHFDLAIVDPPYGIGINTNMGRRRGDKKSDWHKFAGGDKSPPQQSYFDELFRVSKNQIIWGANYMIGHLSPSPCWLIWDKMFSQDVTFAQIELAWTSFKTSAKRFVYSPNQSDRIHPTQKPVALYKWLLESYAKEGDKILDTHLGSGSIAIACHDYGYNLTGCELDPDYFSAMRIRIENHIAQPRIFAPVQKIQTEIPQLF